MNERLTSKDLAAFIEENGIVAEIVHFEVETPTVAAAAEVAGVQPEQIIKSVLFLADGEPVLVVANGTSRVEWKMLADYLGVSRRRLKMAKPDQVLAVTGFVVGSVCPFGHPQKIRTIVETAVPQLPSVLAGGGETNALTKMITTELLRVVGNEIVSLVKDVTDESK